jgi:hypothetical protein
MKPHTLAGASASEQGSRASGSNVVQINRSTLDMGRTRPAAPIDAPGQEPRREGPARPNEANLAPCGSQQVARLSNRGHGRANRYRVTPWKSNTIGS